MVQKLSDLPVGALVKDNLSKYYDKPVIWKIVDKNHYGYPSNTVTLISDKIISLKAFDGKESRNNNYERRSGNNYYKYSNLLQWLNSGLSNWYSAQHGADAPPNSSNTTCNPYDSEPGFLYNFSSDFKNAMVSTSLKTARPKIDGGGSETVTSKIFLASTTEVGLANEEGIAEGTRFPIFDGDESRTAYITAEAVSKNNYKKATTSSPWWWWLRTHYKSAMNVVHVADRDGSLNLAGVDEGRYGVRPLCNLKSEVLVSDNKDADGAYTMLWSNPPSIESTTSTNMGLISKEFNLTYTVREEKAGQTLRVEEYVDNTRVKQFSANSGTSYTFSLSRLAYQKLSNGNHTIKIVATNSLGINGIRIFNFSKNENKIVFTLEKPLVADAMVTRAMINVIGSIPDKSILKVEACNNGNDSNPTWEDVTEKVLLEKKIFLTNKQKMANEWGFNIRVSVERNGATGECYISSIGGNFE